MSVPAAWWTGIGEKKKKKIFFARPDIGVICWGRYMGQPPKQEDFLFYVQQHLVRVVGHGFLKPMEPMVAFSLRLYPGAGRLSSSGFNIVIERASSPGCQGLVHGLTLSLNQGEHVGELD